MLLLRQFQLQWLVDILDPVALAFIWSLVRIMHIILYLRGFGKLIIIIESGSSFSTSRFHFFTFTFFSVRAFAVRGGSFAPGLHMLSSRNTSTV
jgi:hypothetical protein